MMLVSLATDIKDPIERLVEINASANQGKKLQGSVKGDRVVFSVGLDTYSGRVRGKIMNGAASGATSGYWKATRIR